MQGCANAAVGQGTGQSADRSCCTTDCTDRVDCNLKELMLSLGSMSGNLLAGDTLAGRGAGAAGVGVRCRRGTGKAMQ